MVSATSVIVEIEDVDMLRDPVFAKMRDVLPRRAVAPHFQVFKDRAALGVKEQPLHADASISSYCGSIAEALIVQSPPRARVPVPIGTGVNLQLPHLSRNELLGRVYGKLQTRSNRFILLVAPPGSGKSSILKLYADRSPRIHCMYMSFNDPLVSADDLLLERARIDYQNGAADLNATQYHLVMIDDAQEKYDEIGFWNVLMQVASMDIPRNVHFLVCATHWHESQRVGEIEFMGLEQLGRDDFLLSDDEAHAFLTLPTVGLPEHLQMPMLIQVMTRACNGLVGALRMAVDANVGHFEKGPAPSETDVMRYFLSHDCVRRMARCFASTHVAPSGELCDFLTRCVVTPTRIMYDQWKTDQEQQCCKTLKNRGLVTEDDCHFVAFSSPLAELYYSRWLYSKRAWTNPSSLQELITKAIGSLSAFDLQQSVGGATDRFPVAALFQQQFMQGLAWYTAPTCSICRDVSRVFSPSPSDGRPAIGYFLNEPTIQWGLELLVHGDKIQDHTSGYAEGGIDAPLAVNDFAVVNVHGNESGDVTDFKHLEKRVTVVFKLGDFSRCVWSGRRDARDPVDAHPSSSFLVSPRIAVDSMQLIWFQLVHDDCTPFPFVNSVVVEKEDNAETLRAGIFAGVSPDHPPRVSASDLTLFANRAVFNEKQVLAADVSIETLSASLTEALIVQVPRDASTFVQLEDTMDVMAPYLVRSWLVDRTYEKLQSTDMLFRCDNTDVARGTTNLDTREEHVIMIMIDNAQEKYQDKEFWSRLIQTQWPATVRFVICVEHAVEYPVEFDLLAQLGHQELLLSDDEADARLTLPTVGLPDHMQTPALKRVMIRMCNGLVGEFYESVVTVTRHFEKGPTPPETDVLCFYLSDECLQWTAELCFGEIQVAPSAELQNFLIQCLVTPTPKSWDAWKADEGKRCWETLKSRGLVVEDANRTVTFSSPLAERYCSRWLFPKRALSNPSSLHELIKKVLESISAFAVRQSIATSFSTQVTFHQQFLHGLALSTTSTCSICHEVSRVLSPSSLDAQSPIDFYLSYGRTMQWGLELLVRGDTIQDHTSGFTEGGIYAPLAVNDYTVVDIRRDEMGNVADVERKEKRVTVVFSADYSSCRCVFGEGEELEEIASKA